MSVNFADGAIFTEAGAETVETFRRFALELNKIGAEALAGSLLELHAQELEPAHPLGDEIIGVWLYNKIGAQWALKVSVRTTAGAREWRDAVVASS